MSSSLFCFFLSFSISIHLHLCFTDPFFTFAIIAINFQPFFKRTQCLMILFHCKMTVSLFGICLDILRIQFQTLLYRCQSITEIHQFHQTNSFVWIQFRILRVPSNSLFILFHSLYEITVLKMSFTQLVMLFSLGRINIHLIIISFLQFLNLFHFFFHFVNIVFQKRLFIKLNRFGILLLLSINRSLSCKHFRLLDIIKYHVIFNRLDSPVTLFHRLFKISHLDINSSHIIKCKNVLVILLERFLIMNQSIFEVFFLISLITKIPFSDFLLSFLLFLLLCFSLFFLLFLLPNLLLSFLLFSNLLFHLRLLLTLWLWWITWWWTHISCTRHISSSHHIS